MKPLLLLWLLAVTALAERPRRIEAPGLPNFYQITLSLYRGAQPTAQGLGNARVLGVKTVLDLRGFHSDQRIARSAGLRLESIAFHTWHPEDEDVIRFLRIATDPAKQPVFVHCQHGADRTGMMVAFYRIIVQGWSRQAAIAEMTSANFGFHPMWQNLVRYIESVDIREIRTRAGLGEQQATDRD